MVLGVASALETAVNVITGFSMGASSIALFARVGGGIYTKAADVGADLVGKVEAGIPEDDPRNPAVIADNVGDNVGDVAGMGADLFESYVGAIVGAMVLGASPSRTERQQPAANAVVLPLVLAAVGIVVSIVGTFFVRTKEGGNPQHRAEHGHLRRRASSWLSVTGSASQYMWPGSAVTAPGEIVTWRIVRSRPSPAWSSASLVGIITEYYTADAKAPGRQHRRSSRETGAATNIIAGLGVGMQSTALPIIVDRHRDRRRRYHVAGLYGIAIAALGMLSHHRHPARGRRLRPDRRQRRRHRRDGRPGRPRCASAPTSSTPSATPPPPSARASPSAPPR